MTKIKSNRRHARLGRPGADSKPQMKNEPKPPFPRQHQKGTGLESKLDPQPRYHALRYKAAGKLEEK